MRPNLFANMPDILHEFLQHGGPGAFRIRLVLAATLGANYGIYSGFELCENVPVRPGSEEYLARRSTRCASAIGTRRVTSSRSSSAVNQIRRAHPALQADRSLRFYATDNPNLICYAKSARDLDDHVLVVVSLDPHHVQQGFVQAPPWELATDRSGAFRVEDLLTGSAFTWRSEWNFVRLAPDLPAHVLRLPARREVATV